MNFYVIGNGFDLDHGMTTSYRDFKQFYDKYNCNALGDVELYFEYDGDFWNDFENNLSCVDYKMFISSMYGLQDPVCTRRRKSKRLKYNKYEFSHLLVNYKELQTILRLWISSVSLPRPKYIFDKDDFFLSFNYSLVLETTYKISSKNICHIHGSLLNQEELQIGFSGLDIPEIMKIKNHPFLTNILMRTWD